MPELDCVCVDLEPDVSSVREEEGRMAVDAEDIVREVMIRMSRGGEEEEERSNDGESNK